MHDDGVQWIVMRRWPPVRDNLFGMPWQPACQLTFDTQAEAEAHMAELEPDSPSREFKVVNNEPQPRAGTEDRNLD